MLSSSPDKFKEQKQHVDDISGTKVEPKLYHFCP